MAIGSGNKLVGDYGKISTIALGAEISSGDTATDGTWYLITGVGGTSGFDGTPQAGYLYRGGGETLGVGDTAKPVTITDKCDGSAWSLSSSNPEIDITTLCDNVNVYETGKTDISGSLSGFFTYGATDGADYVQNKFAPIVRQASGTYSIDGISTDVVYFFLYAQKNTTAGDIEGFYVVPAKITSFEHSISNGEAQGYSSDFRPTVDAENGIEFQFVEYTHA